MHTLAHPLHRLLRTAVPGFLLVLLSATAVLGAAPGASPQEDRLEHARNLFREAEYDSARVVVESVAADEALPTHVRVEAFHLLGLVNTVLGEYGPAREAIEAWITLDPDNATVNPDLDLLDFVYLYYEVRKGINERLYCEAGFEPPHPCQYGEPQTDPGIQTIAILDFDNNSIDDRDRLDPLRGGLSDLMIRQLNGTIGLKIVEREQLAWILNELDLSRTGQVDPETAVRVGRLMSAHVVLLGDYMYFNKELQLGARLVKVETSEILLTAQESGKLDDFGDVAGRLSADLADAVGARLKRAEWEDRTPSNRLEALLAFAEGLAAYDAGEHKEAAAKFELALEHDPGYNAARTRYEALRPMLVAQRENR